MGSVEKINRPKPYRARWRERGRHRSRSFSTEAEAEDFLIMANEGAAVDGMSLYTALNLWLSEVKATCRHTTNTHYRHIARAFCARMGKGTKLEGITTAHIAEYRDYFARERHPKTVNNHLRAIRAFFNVAVRRGWIGKNPVKGVKFPRYRSRVPAWIDQEPAQWLIQTAEKAPPEIRAAVVLALRAGLRLGDIVGLRWQDVEHGVITVNEGKSKDPRIIPIHADVSAALSALPRRGVYILPHRHDLTKHRHTHQFGQKVNHWLKRSGYAATLHALRHSFACHLAEAGATMVDLRRLMGHTSIATTEIYLHSSPSRQADLIGKLGRPASRLRVLTSETAPSKEEAGASGG